MPRYSRYGLCGIYAILNIVLFFAQIPPEEKSLLFGSSRYDSDGEQSGADNVQLSEGL